MDNLTICARCGSDACYSQEVNESITNYQCMGCGFISNSLMKKDSEFIKEQSEILPELYKDLMHIDKNNRAWFPATITLPGKGMVFADGTSKDDWSWSAVKAIPITDEDRKLKQYPADQDFKMDMANAQKFGKGDFMDALEVIGFFNAQ